MTNPTTTSGLLAASAQIGGLTGGRLIAARLIADGTNAATLTVYDSENSSVSGKKVLWKLTVPATGLVDDVVFNSGCAINLGIYAVLTGTGANFIVAYTA